MFFKIWAVVILLNQLFFYSFCLKIHCIIAALPHTGIISFILALIWEEKKPLKFNSSSDTFNDEEKLSESFCKKCNNNNSHDSKFCIYCGEKLDTLKAKKSYQSSYDKSLYKEISKSYDGILVAFLAKVAKVDGKISQDEAKFIGNIYDELCDIRIDIENIREIYKQILHNEKSNYSNVNKLCKKLINLNLDESLKISIIEVLIELAYVDNEYDDKEENLIIKIVYGLHLDFSIYKNLVDKYSFSTSSGSSHSFNNLSLDDCYQILESTKESSNSDIKKSYRRLVRQYHTDMLSSKDLPADMIKFAEEKLKSINSAYEKIKKYRGIK